MRPSAPAPGRSAARPSGWPSVALRAPSSVAPSALSAVRSPARRPKVTTRPAPGQARSVAVLPGRSSVARWPDLRVPSSAPRSVPAAGAGAGDQTEEEVEEVDTAPPRPLVTRAGSRPAHRDRDDRGPASAGPRSDRPRRMIMARPLRIAQVAPPMERVPPRAYGGTERIVFELVKELDRRGHEVTTFASGDSEVPGRHIATVEEALRPSGYSGDPSPWFYLTIQEVLDRAARVRHHPQPPRVGQLPARPGLADPGRLDVPRPARPRLGGGELRAPDARGSSRSAPTRPRPIPRSSGPASSTTA